MITRYCDRALKLLVEVQDVVPPDRDVLMRRHVLRLSKGSPVRAAALIAYANFNPTASKRALLPTEDWCEEVSGTDVVAYDRARDAMVSSVSETDGSTGRPSSMAVAFGADARSSAPR